MFYSVICESNLLQYKHLGVYPINRIDRWGLSASDTTSTAYSLTIASGGGAIVVGAKGAVGIVWDTEGNIGVTLTGEVGVGVEVDVPIASDLIDIIAKTITSGTSIESINGTIQDFEGDSYTATSSVIVGLEMDMDTTETDITLGATVGGGVYKGETIVIEIIDGDGK